VLAIEKLFTNGSVLAIVVYHIELMDPKGGIMTAQIRAEQVWEAIEKELFAVIGMVTANEEARTVGVVYVMRGRKLYIASGKKAWKVRHIAANPHVSMTIPIAKRIPFMPWFKIPAATITFCGKARILEAEEAPPELLRALFRGMVEDQERMAESCLIEVTPEKEFLTYGVGIPLMQMRDPEKARGRVPVASSDGLTSHAAERG